MLKSYSTSRLRRILALTTAICCIWLSAFGQLFHTDCVLSGGDVTRTVSRETRTTVRAASHRSETTLTTTTAHPPHCIACEWQANSVAQALPAYVVELTPADCPRAVTTFARYLNVVTVSTPSRAPPAA